ncbi:hypothetical protein Hanom_Chr15g01337871 [Helianthus anomalus]
MISHILNPANWTWWIYLGVCIGIIAYVMRGFQYRVEKINTHYMKSFQVGPHWTDTKSYIFLLGDIWWDWAGNPMLLFLGWDGSWVGQCSYAGGVWAGYIVGWDGEIRGWQIGTTLSYSGCHLVFCSSPSILWSLRLFYCPCPYNLMSLHNRGHYRRFVCVAGYSQNPGDIRKDQIGGLSFRWNPPCILTPILETFVRNRNLLISVCYFCSGLGWTEGWVRWLDRTLWWWLNTTVFYYEGTLVNMGWDKIISLMLLALGCRIMYWKRDKNWLHQTRMHWRITSLCTQLIWPRGSFVIKGGVKLFTLLCKLGWKCHLCDSVQLVKKYGSTRNNQRHQQNAGKFWACFRSRTFWVGTTVCWKLYKMCFKCWQPNTCFCFYKMMLKPDRLLDCPRGIYVFSGWDRSYPGLLYGWWVFPRLCCTLRGCCKGLGLLTGLPSYSGCYVLLAKDYGYPRALQSKQCSDCKWLDVLFEPPRQLYDPLGYVAALRWNRNLLHICFFRCRDIRVICTAVTISWVHHVCQSWITSDCCRPGNYVHMRADRKLVQTRYNCSVWARGNFVSMCWGRHGSVEDSVWILQNRGSCLAKGFCLLLLLFAAAVALIRKAYTVLLSSIVGLFNSSILESGWHANLWSGYVVQHKRRVSHKKECVEIMFRASEYLCGHQGPV